MIIHSEKEGLIYSRKFVKFGKFESRIYNCQLIKGEWPDIDSMINECSNGEPHGGGQVIINGSKAKVTIFTG